MAGVPRPSVASPAAIAGLLEPVTLGRATAPNRLVFGPHETNLGLGRSLSDRHVAYYRRRAPGGCGTVVVETASVHASDWPYERAPLAAECGEGWQAIAEAVHADGGLVLASLGHAGGQGSSAYSQRALWAPSRFPDPATREVPQQMEAEDIAAVVAGFAAAAALAVSAGLDGVEVNAGQLSLVRQFLSGLTNTRDDDYGADRLRFAREVLAADPSGRWVRGRCSGCAWPATSWLRGPASPPRPPSPSLGRSPWPIWRPSTTSWPSGRRPSTSGGTRPDGHTEPGFALPLAAALRRRPAGRRWPWWPRDRSSTRPWPRRRWPPGSADVVEMTRAQIADPDLAAKLAGGRVRRRCGPACSATSAARCATPATPSSAASASRRRGYETEEPRLGDAGPRPAPRRARRRRPVRRGWRRPGSPPCRGHRVRVCEAGRPAGGSLADGGGRGPAGPTWPTWPTGSTPSAAGSGWRSPPGRRWARTSWRDQLSAGGVVRAATGSAARAGVATADDGTVVRAQRRPTLLRPGGRRRARRPGAGPGRGRRPGRRRRRRVASPSCWPPTGGRSPW